MRTVRYYPRMMELVDVADLKSAVRKDVPVRVRLRGPTWQGEMHSRALSALFLYILKRSDAYEKIRSTIMFLCPVVWNCLV